MKVKNFLYLSPEFPVNFQNFIRKLKEQGISVWAIGEGDFFHLPEDIRNSLNWYESANLHDFGSVEHALWKMMENNPQLHHESFQHIESHNECWLALEAYLNEKFNIDQAHPALMDTWKRKSKMKEVFINNGIPCAKGELVKNLNHALSIIEKIGFPAILKPDYGVGASGIFVINNHQDLHNIIPSLQSDYLLEEFVSAPMLTFDGLAGANGEILFANSLEYSEGILEYVHGKDPSFFINKQIDPVLMQLGERLVKAFNIKKRFFHFEFFKMEDEVKYWPVEINCRPPGGPIIDMMNYSVDQDLYQSYARLIAGEDVHLANEKKYYCGYVGRRFGKHYFNEHDLVMKRYDSYFVECVENPHVFRQAMGDFRYIFRTDDEVILKKIMAELLTH